MTVQIQDTASLISIIIVLCFSFCITVITVWFRNAEAQSRLLGYSFISAFLLNVSALLVNDHELTAILSQITEPLLLLLILLTIAAKPEKKHYMLFGIILILLPAALLFSAILSLPVRSLFSHQYILLPTSILIAIAILYVLKNKKGDMSILFWSIFSLTASVFAQCYLTFGIAVFMTPLIKLTAYSVLLLFFFHVFLKSQLVKAEEAEKKLAAINRSIEYEVKKRMLELEKVNQKLLNISKTDSMSKVMNNAALCDSIDSLIHKNHGLGFSILMFDIDNFKLINDTLGHVAGDKCIKMLAATARNSIRDIDMIGRYGGDEFVIVLPDIDINQAIIIAERFRRRVESTDSPHFTVSIGIASYPADGSDVIALIKAADEGMYKSKSKGRNAVSHKNYY